jgi:Methyltransferase domain
LLPSRYELPVLLNHRRLTGCGAEIGVQAGLFSEHLLQEWEGMHLISVDPWLAAPTDEYVDISNVDQEEHDRLYAETCARFARFGDRSSVWRTTSLEAADRIPDHCLDFVYLDARHDYESVKEDLESWFPKVRPGGVIAGHDYYDDVRPEGVYGVQSAVDEFFAERRLPVSSTFHDSPWDSWIAEKPQPNAAVSGMAWMSGSLLRSGLAQLRRFRLWLDAHRGGGATADATGVQ